MTESGTYWIAICGNASEDWAFWSSDMTWDTMTPTLTVCFQKTVLQWLPCAMLLAVSALYLPTLRKRKSGRCGRGSNMNILKIAVCLFLVIISIVEFVRVVAGSSAGSAVPPVLFMNPVVEILLMLLAIFMMRLEHVKGIHSSGALFLFWLLKLFCHVFIFASQCSRLVNSTSDAFLEATAVISSILVLSQWLVHCFADTRARRTFVQAEKRRSLLSELSSSSPTADDETNNVVERSCPELEVSFLSRATFAWITSLVIRGHRQTLTSADAWDFRPGDRSRKIIADIEHQWRRLFNSRISRGQKPPDNAVRYSKNLELVNSRLLQDVTVTARKKKVPSVFTALCKVFRAQFVLAGFLKLIMNFMFLAQPLLLKQLIGFIKKESPYEWHGYVFAITLFLNSAGQMLLYHNYFFCCNAIGMQLRSAIIGLVYRKALKLSGSSRKNRTVGEIVNLMSVDSERVEVVPNHLHILWADPILIAMAMVLLWQEVGVSSLAGMSVIILLIPVNAVIVSKVKKLQVHQMKLKDLRLKWMSEILTGIKVLKLYAWESSFQKTVSSIREQEVSLLKKAACLNAADSVTWFCAPFMVCLSTFAVYVLSSSDNVLTSEKAFVALSLFNIMNVPLAFMPMSISHIVQCIVSARRINDFLLEEELDPSTVERDPMAEDAIQIDNGTFLWDLESPPALRNLNLSIPDGKLYAVVGTVGCGKSSLINAILGEMQKSEGRVAVKGSIAYVPQQAWCQNCSLQDNILFGRDMQRKRYDRVLDACALKPDLKVLTAGDQTEIGEKGINLSGGQKQRVSLARAVYQDADIYLLDDPLSAVDSHVGKHLFEQVISREGLLANKTRVLVTHSLSHLSKVDCIIVLKDGAISEMGSYTELLSHGGPFAELIRTYLEQEDAEEEDEELVILKAEVRRNISKMSDSDGGSAYLGGQHSTGSDTARRRVASQSSLVEVEQLELERQQKELEKLMTTETVEEGSIKISVFLEYIKAFSTKVAAVMGVSFVLFVAVQVSTTVWLSKWSEDTTTYNDTARRDLYLGVYGAFGAGQAIFILMESIALAFGTFFASRGLHLKLLDKVMKTPMSFFDTTPIGRILNRCGRDMDITDESLPTTMRFLFEDMQTLCASLLMICVAFPIFLVVAVPLIIFYIIIQRFYISTSRQLNRIVSTKRSPIYSHFQESVVGTTSIRAYKREREFIEKSDDLVDESQRIWYNIIVTYRWVGMAVEVLSCLVVLFVAVFSVVYRSSIGAGLAGAAISYAMMIGGTAGFVVNGTSDFETRIVAVERITEYIGLPTEAPQLTDFRPPLSWPSLGRVQFRDYSVRYRPDLDLVLKNIAAVVNPGEKVGIVGRTGAGKSSLTMGLFRILEPASGDILIDDISVTSIGLHDLRSRLTIIPQDPVLFSGTLRMNLDPFDAYSDGEVWSALDQAHLRTFVTGLADGLQHKCSEGGENLSVGQRQLVCLARALLRRTKVLVLDEATAAVDLETDDLIQNTIRKQFKGCTILTIAHRLNTILDYDRIMVLDKGEVKEMESPGSLLRRPDSIFYGMCRDAGLV